MKRVEVRRLRTFFICGSGKVSQISATSSGAKKASMISMFVRMKATFFIPFWKDSFAPAHIRAPLMSTPMKFFSGKSSANATVYSPRPHPSSSTIGLSLPKNSLHFPFKGKASPVSFRAEKVYWNTCGKDSISPNFASLFFPILQHPHSYFRNTRQHIHAHPLHQIEMVPARLGELRVQSEGDRHMVHGAG